MAFQIKGLEHVGIPCACGNLDESIDFYVQFGFKVLTRHENLNNCNIAMLDNGGCVLELYELRDPKAKAMLHRGEGSISHLALRCDDLDAAYAYVAEKGYQIVSDGIESIGLYAPQKCRYFLFLGPNFEKVEFTEVKD